MNERCKTCRFWDADGRDGYDKESPGSDFSMCHRYPPPRPYKSKDEAPHCFGLFPLTIADDWCGEWQRRANIREFDLSMPLRQVVPYGNFVAMPLELRGIRTLGDVLKMTEAELADIPGFGPTSLFKLMDALKELGLALRQS